MYNPLLKTFITVADCGSFLKASERLYISPTAVMKQINQLEKHLNITLLNRTNQGITLTSEGKCILDASRKFIELSNETLSHAHSIHKKEQYTILIGSSLLYPSSTLMNLWYKISIHYPEYRLRIIPFEDAENVSVSHFINSRCDMITGAYDSTMNHAECQFLKLGEYSFCLAMSRTHPLAQKASIQPSELTGQRLLIMQRGNSPRNDEIRDLLEQSYPSVILEDTPVHYGLEHFNRCEEENCLLLTLEGWENIHPSLVTIPFNVKQRLPYGILYSNHPTQPVQEFLNLIKSTL